MIVHGSFTLGLAKSCATQYLHRTCKCSIIQLNHAAGPDPGVKPRNARKVSKRTLFVPVPSEINRFMVLIGNVESHTSSMSIGCSFSFTTRKYINPVPELLVYPRRAWVDHIYEGRDTYQVVSVDP